MKCKICGEEVKLRLGVCFTCADFESIIEDGTDMHDEPIKIEDKTLSKSGNILKQIIKEYTNNSV